MSLHLRKSLHPYLASVLAPMLCKIGAARASDTRQEYKINTVVGMLFVAIYEDWVHCCFEDVAAAKAHFKVTGICQHRLNPCSGKWNWHHWDVRLDDVHLTGVKRDRAILDLLAVTVWREIQDLTPEAVEESKRILVEHEKAMKAIKAKRK